MHFRDAFLQNFFSFIETRKHPSQELHQSWFLCTFMLAFFHFSVVDFCIQDAAESRITAVHLFVNDHKS